MSNSKLEYIDTLRGVAILMVVVVHTAQSVFGINEYIKVLCEYGQMGVQLFFFLSAYTLCASLESTLANKKYENKWLVPFYIKRFFRIAPLYYWGILMYGILATILRHNPHLVEVFGARLIKGPLYTFKNVLSNVLFVHNFYFPARDKIVPGGWSIGAEMAFYTVFPFIFLFYKKVIANKMKTWLIVIPVVAFAISFLLFYSMGLTIGFVTKKLIVNENNNFFYYNILNQIPVFFVGISFYFFNKYIKQIINIYFAVFAFLALTSLTIIISQNYFNLTFVPFLASLSYIFLFFIFKSIPNLNPKFLQRIGQLSFSIYLFHFIFAWPLTTFFVNVLNSHFALNPNLLLLICIMACIILPVIVAMVSERLIEKPGIDLGHKLIKRYLAKKTPQVVSES